MKSFRSAKEWEDWLRKNHDSSDGEWLRLAKKSAGMKSVTYQQAVDVALCYGWIDSQSKSLDDRSWVQRFTPRGPKSIWSKINRAKVAVLIRKKKMRKPGRAAIERAKENGRWKGAYDSHRTARVPGDFRSALSRSPEAKSFFGTLNRQNRYSILFRIQTAVKPGTRRKRIDRFVMMLSKNEKLYP